VCDCAGAGSHGKIHASVAAENDDLQIRVELDKASPRDRSPLGHEVLCVCSNVSAGLFANSGIDGQAMHVLGWTCCDKNAWV
jgi:hypothetical protein